MADRELKSQQSVSGLTEQETAARIHVDGVVQGVGFRPYIYSLALAHDMVGWVKNTSAGVDILVEGSSNALDQFIANIEVQAPPLAIIEKIDWDYVPLNGYQEFTIRQSESKKGEFQPISPDVSLCLDCRREMLDDTDRRYRYPFINCTNCGPRFTIIRGLPYDRPDTTMAEFELCPECSVEYQDPLDRRFHAQPIACPQCGPHVWLERNGEELCSKGEAISEARNIIQAGGLIALKGLGGYQLACDAANSAAVQRLRQIKAREAKPFALMVCDLETAKSLCRLTEAAQELLQSRERPILLLPRNDPSAVADNIAPGQSTLGIMLPYTPLHELLMEQKPEFPRALVMTSANRAGEPIIHTIPAATTTFSSGLEAMLHHNRPIEQRCDDSVYRSYQGSTYPLRRARGYAPYPVQLAKVLPEIFASGAELKNTFCLTKDRYAFLSQHIGDLSNYETLLTYEQTLDHFLAMFQITPELVAYDIHPDYLSTQYARNLSQEKDLPAYPIQHHQAHIGACLAEHKHDPTEPAIGFAFDGTGYGSDGAIWGGEVFTFVQGDFHRAFHLKYVGMPGGEMAVRHPWRLALAWLHSMDLDWDDRLASVSAATTQERQLLDQQISRQINSPMTSSVGRLFDAVASLVGLRQHVSYEAQAAMELEALVDTTETMEYPFELKDGQLDPAPMFRQLVAELKSGVQPPAIASRFHRGLARAVLNIALKLRRQTDINTVVLSGGVWQNMHLLQWTQELLSAEEFNILIHQRVPANDGGLSLGQAWLAGHHYIMGKNPGDRP